MLEEVDDLATKVEIRRHARALGVPVVMVTDDGDNVIVDVERYDLDPGYPLFHGNAGDVTDLDPRRCAIRLSGCGSPGPSSATTSAPG